MNTKLAETQEKTGKFVANHVYCCISSLVDEIMKNDSDLYYEFENISRGVCPLCGEPVQGEDCGTCGAEEIEPEQEYNEILEYWAVSEYLFSQLRDHGEPVLEHGTCYIWGRCTSGQAIKLDSVIEDIALN